MTGKVETEKPRTDAQFEKKKSPKSNGGDRQVEHVAKPNPALTTSKDSSGQSSPSTLDGLPKLDIDTFNTLTHGDKRKRTDGPPPLPFDLRQHKLSIGIFSFLAYAECCFVPIALYYGLSKGTKMRSGKSCQHRQKVAGQQLMEMDRPVLRHHHESVRSSERI